jgi:putative restriction endonuclease
MRFFVGMTDNAWYRHLAALRPDEVNFWRPSGKSFAAIEVGAPFLFKLHSPENYIGGGGYFVRAERLPLSLAWEAFEQKNGAANLEELLRLIRHRRKDNHPDPEIGCIILNQPFFIPREHWIPQPEDWKPEIVAGKGYDTRDLAGKRIWDRVQPWLPKFEPCLGAESPSFAKGEPPPLYGNEYLTKVRLGQGTFRVLVTSAYKRRCAVTGEKTLPVLQASHIKPYGKGPNRVDNGLLLRSDLHILFDRGYMTVTPKLQIAVSRRIKEEFENGREYQKLHGGGLQVLPSASADRPNLDFLRWHNQEVFRG